MTKREHRSIIIEPFYRDFELYNRTEKKCREGFYEKMLENTIDDLEAILSNHNKLNVIRFDLYFTKPDNDTGYTRIEPDEVNGYVSRFFNSLQEKMVRLKKKGKNRGLKRSQIAYQFAMEETTEKLVHVHCYIAYKGLAQQDKGSRIADRRTKKKVGMYEIIEDTWKSVVPSGSGRVQFGTPGKDNHFYSIERGSKDFQKKIEDCIYGLSYIAKVYSKNTIEVDNTRKFNSSRRIERGHCDITLTGRRHSKGVEPITELSGLEELMEFEVAPISHISTAGFDIQNVIPCQQHERI